MKFIVDSPTVVKCMTKFEANNGFMRLVQGVIGFLEGTANGNVSRAIADDRNSRIILNMMFEVFEFHCD